MIKLFFSKKIDILNIESRMQISSRLRKSKILKMYHHQIPTGIWKFREFPKCWESGKFPKYLRIWEIPIFFKSIYLRSGHAESV